MMSKRSAIWTYLQTSLGLVSICKGLKFYELIYERIVRLTGIPVPLKIRQIYDALQEKNIEFESALPEISLGIVCHPKDFERLELVVEMAYRNCLNPISEVTLVTTPEGYEPLKRMFPHFNVWNEDQFVSTQVLKTIADYVPKEIKGWVLQQTAKFTIVLRSRNMATLILDADTVLLQERAFLTQNGTQALSYSHEYHLPYAEHYGRFSSQPIDSKGHSFVTHHQLMQKSVVMSLLGTEGDGLCKWIKEADYNVFSPLCEYHCYGEEITRKYPNKYKLVRWGNRPVSSDEYLRATEKSNFVSLSRAFKGCNSISIHSYL
jgi:hypothetical protein